MQSVLADLVPAAVPVALSPLPIVAVLILLIAPAGWRGGVGFVLGRVLALAGATLAFAWAAGYVDSTLGGDARGGWRILAGLALMAAAATLARRPRPADARPSGWMGSIEALGPAGAVRLGLTVTVINVKELAFTFAAGAIISGAGLTSAQTAGAAAIFAVLSSTSVAVPVAALAVSGDPVRTRLAALRDALVRNQSLLTAIVLGIIGAMLVGKGIAAL